MKEDIRHRDSKELYLIVENTEKYYILKKSFYSLVNKLNNDFIYNYRQLKYLVNNL